MPTRIVHHAPQSTNSFQYSGKEGRADSLVNLQDSSRKETTPIRKAMASFTVDSISSPS